MKAIDLSQIDDFNEISKLTKQFGIVEFAHILVSDLKNELKMEIQKFELNEDTAGNAQIEIFAYMVGDKYILRSTKNQVYKIININQEFHWARIARNLEQLIENSFNCAHFDNYMLFVEYINKRHGTIVQFVPNESYKKLLEIGNSIEFGALCFFENEQKKQSLLFKGDLGTHYEVTCLEDKYVFQNLRYGYSFDLSLWLGQAFFEKSLKS
jgi:hypothetical protein